MTTGLWWKDHLDDAATDGDMNVADKGALAKSVQAALGDWAAAGPVASTGSPSRKVDLRAPMPGTKIGADSTFIPRQGP